jgi:hypothetical protein
LKENEMKFRKPSFSEIQKNFIEKFVCCLEKDFKGEQLALAARIGCDQSSISRWANKETAPPDYVCRLLLKELGAGSFKQSLGQRIQFLREKVYQVSLREFAWALKLDSVSQLEAVEQGEVELPRQSIEILMQDYRVQAGFLDQGEKVLFSGIATNTESFLAHLKDGFTLHFVTPPANEEDRSWKFCMFVFHRSREHLPQCFVATAPGSFKSTGGGLLLIEHAVWALMAHAQTSRITVPTVIMADKKSWKDLRQGYFYNKTINFGGGSGDIECTERLIEIHKSLCARFDAHQKRAAEKNASGRSTP